MHLQSYDSALQKCNIAIEYLDNFLKNGAVYQFTDLDPGTTYFLLLAHKGIILFKSGKKDEGLKILSMLNSEADNNEVGKAILKKLKNIWHIE
jgi:hypothetical protein